ncbi:MAG: hypothetical protein RJA10_2309 [Pseudomonadota bacterium]
MNSVPVAESGQHPMDAILVRPLRFDAGRVSDGSLLWSVSKPEFSMFANALGIHVPWFERFLVSVMRQSREQVSSDRLRRDMRSIIGQEANHAHAFAEWNRRLIKRYPELAALDAKSKHHFEHLLETGSAKFKTGFVAGYETFTFLAGLIILDRYHELMGDADPVLRALWVWHQVEEVEHGSVAFDVFQDLHGQHEWYRKAMVLFAALHIVSETFKAYHPMVKGEGWYRSPRRAWAAWRFFAGFAFDLFWSALPVFRRRYHPRMHPRCNGEQNRIAVAWRAWAQAGGDPTILEAAAVDGWCARPPNDPR